MAAKPNEMSKEAWDYLLKFTRHHEVPVLHMYNNKKTAADKQDITFGVGVQINSPQAALGYRKYFFDKSGSQASDAAIIDDWNKVSVILRKGASVKEYEDATQCRVTEPAVLELMAEKLRGNLMSNMVSKKEKLESFVSMPAQAQIALASYFYGHFLPPKMGAAASVWDFYTAGKESFLNGMSKRKFNAHVTLFANAAQIVAQKLEYQTVPTNVETPEAIPTIVDETEARRAGAEMALYIKAAKLITPYILNPMQLGIGLTTQLPTLKVGEGSF